MPGENFRVDEAELAGGEISRQSRHRASQHKRAELVSEYRVAERAHPALVGLDARQRASEGRMQHFAQQPVHANQDSEHEVIELNWVFEIERLNAGYGEFGPNVDVNAIRAATQFGVVEYRIQHLREGECHH